MGLNPVEGILISHISLIQVVLTQKKISTINFASLLLKIFLNFSGRPEIFIIVI